MCGKLGTLLRNCSMDPLGGAHKTENQRQAPTSLIIVAVLFIVSGVFATLDILVSLTRGNININLGVISIFVGIGLLRFRHVWRIIGLVICWISMVIIPIFALLAVGDPGRARIMFLGVSLGRAPLALSLIVAVIGFALVFWQYRVLTRPGIVALFYPQNDAWK